MTISLHLHDVKAHDRIRALAATKRHGNCWRLSGQYMGSKMTNNHDYRTHPTSEYRFFLFDPEWEGLMFFRSEAERDAAAKEAINAYKDVDNGWSEEVERLLMGEATHVCTKANVVERPSDEELDEEGCDGEGTYWDPAIELRCDYEMLPIGNTPLVKAQKRLEWAAEVRRLRSEIDSAREDLQSFIEDRNHWKTKAEAAEAVLQNLMSYLSVNGCRTEIDPENAELRIRDGINMLVRPAMERAELAEKALKEAQEQEPVAYMIHEYQGTGEKRLQFQPHIPSIRDDVTGPIVTALYARPVPAAPVVAVPAVPTDEQIHAAYRKALGQSIRERDMPEIRKFARALLQTTGEEK